MACHWCVVLLAACTMVRLSSAASARHAGAGRGATLLSGGLGRDAIGGAAPSGPGRASVEVSFPVRRDERSVAASVFHAHQAEAALHRRSVPAIIETEARPNIGGKPDVVEFGITLTSVMNIDVSHDTFMADVVLFLRWEDARTAHLLPDGITELTMSSKAAGKEMWLPDVAICNSNFGGSNLISSAVSVSKGGNVSMISRSMNNLLNRFDTTSFPFDRPELKILVSSTTLMFNELQLKPVQGENSMGVAKDILRATDLRVVNITQRAFGEQTGGLWKSRGEFVLATRRDSAVYLRQKILPMLFLVTISFGVFYVPILAPFAMPRCATALIAFLALVTMGQKSSAAEGGACWIDLFEECCQILLFFTVILNMVTLTTFHQLKLEQLALRMEHELKVIPPLLAGLNFSVLFWFTREEDIEWASLGTRLISGLGSLSYIAVSGWRMYKGYEAQSAEKAHAQA